MVAMMGHAARFTRVVIDHVGVGQAFDRMLAVAESKYGRGCHEAKRRKGRECNRKPEPDSLRQCRQHRLSLLLVPCNQKPRTGPAERQARDPSQNALPRQKAPCSREEIVTAGEEQRSVLVADIGGTNARFALADLATLELSACHQVHCAEHKSLDAALGAYLSTLPERPSQAVIAVAGPVTSDAISLTNAPWSFTREELCRTAGFAEVMLLNDFAALAHALPHLSGADLHQIGGGAVVEQATKLVLGPGTGLGVAALVWSGERFVAVPGEGGHATLGASDERELALLERVRKGREHLSVERVLSGPGIAELYCAVAASHGEGEGELKPNEIVERALCGDVLAVETLELFTTLLGRFAGDAALLVGARGGVYLGGGIAPKIARVLSGGTFRAAFEQKGRMTAYLEPIPVYVILAEFAALKGAAAALRAGS
jgi:glucokinase